MSSAHKSKIKASSLRDRRRKYDPLRGISKMNDNLKDWEKRAEEKGRIPKSKTAKERVTEEIRKSKLRKRSGPGRGKRGRPSAVVDDRILDERSLTEDIDPFTSTDF